jgi:integrase
VTALATEVFLGDPSRFTTAKQVASYIGIAPHDLRKTCAKLCHSSGGELEQIQFLLGHASVQTTER